NGQYQKGLIHVLMLVAIIMLTANADGLFGLMFIIYVPYMVVDAYATAKAMETGSPLPDYIGLTSMFSSGAAAVGSAPGTPVAPGYRQDNAPVGAIVLIGLGCLFLLNTMGIFQFSVGRLIAPLFLIFFGTWKAFQRLQVR